MSLVVVFCREDFFVDDPSVYPHGEHVFSDRRQVHKAKEVFLFYVQNGPRQKLQGFDSTQTCPSQLSMV